MLHATRYARDAYRFPDTDGQALADGSFNVVSVVPDGAGKGSFCETSSGVLPRGILEAVKVACLLVPA